MKKIISALLIAVLTFSCCSCAISNDGAKEMFDNVNKVSYSTSYKKLSDSKNKTSAWRQGMVSGNGLQGVVTSGAPYSDTLIYQNIHFILPNKNSRTCPDTTDEYEAVRQAIVNGEDIVDEQSYDDVYTYHPGAVLRITQKSHIAQDYVRYTDYETAEVGVSYKDTNGEWLRTTFTSRADNVTITKMSKSSQGSLINATLSFDEISAIANYGGGNETDLKYKKILSDDCSYFAQVAHYPNYENSELKNGGYATVTYIVCEGGTKQKTEGKISDIDQFAGEENPQVEIKDAENVYLITISDRTYDMGDISDFATMTSSPLVDSLANTVREVCEKYTDNGVFNYESALNEHLTLYKPQFDAVTLSLGNGDSDLSNDKLISAQKNSKTIHSDLAQKAYYNGRYAYLCCSGTSATRLYGMWTGEWKSGWGSKYTMDANVNLQASSLNTGNISSTPEGYIKFILRQADDWEENATATHGMHDAIQAPVNSDGDKAILTESCYPYPFRYWNAGASWMLQVMYETWQYYGNMNVELSDEFSLYDLRSVLSLTDEDLTDEQISEIEQRGYLDFEKEILLPLLVKSANYWQQLLSCEYYTDANGDIHYQQGKSSLADDETYCIVPSYTPENNPKNYPSPSTANCAIDISACRSNMEMLISIMKDVNESADVSVWQNIIDKLPPYLYDETGAVKEWACNQFEENNEHRHLSHLYLAWPLNETQNNKELQNAAIQAVSNRESENEASHALVHRSLIAARLKDRDSLTQAMLGLMSDKIYYKSLMTNHDTDRGSAYCTDFCIGYLGIVNESLLYSDEGIVEILPTLPTSGFDSGTVTGLRARTRAEISSLVWDIEKKTAQVTICSDIDQTIKVSCGLSDESETINFEAGQPQTVEFKLK